MFGRYRATAQERIALDRVRAARDARKTANAIEVRPGETITCPACRDCGGATEPVFADARRTLVTDFRCTPCWRLFPVTAHTRHAACP